MHGLRTELLEIQADSIGIPLTLVELPEEPDMATYERVMERAVSSLRNEGFSVAAFGDIFLEDLRQFREKQLKPLGIHSVFPIWKKNTTKLIHEFIGLGFKAIVIAINEKALDISFLGRLVDETFVSELPENVDPCGENGEFHTFCFDGPIFKYPVTFSIGDKVRKTYKSPAKEEREMGFWFCDLLPEK